MLRPSSLRSLRSASLLSLLLGFASALAACGGETGASSTTGEPDAGPTFSYPHDSELRLNQIQAKGTHNSYHIAAKDPIMALAYTHAPLDEQLQREGVRQIELDTHYNYYKDVYEVYHLGGMIDEGTTCRVFTDCLKVVKGWSDKNPAHHPIFIQIEPKDEPTADEAEGLFQKLEADILSVFPRQQVIAPDDVRGGGASVRENLAQKGWPTLGEVRGKVLFFVDNGGSFRDHYTHGKTNVDGRLMFIDGDLDSPWAGVILANTPDTDAAKIAAAVKANLIVRTRADGDNVEPFAGDTTHRDEALKSGAQLVSTDYPVAVKGVNYVVEIPDGTPSRCNPITAPPDCTSAWIEDPQFIQP